MVAEEYIHSMEGGGGGDLCRWRPGGWGIIHEVIRSIQTV